MMLNKIQYLCGLSQVYLVCLSLLITASPKVFICLLRILFRVLTFMN